jgi:hypothetical protein
MCEQRRQYVTATVVRNVDIDGRMGEWVNRRMGGWMDGWIDRHI